VSQLQHWIINRASAQKQLDMKKIFLLGLLLITALIPAIAQDGGGVSGIDWTFGSFAALCAVIPFLVEIIKSAVTLSGLAKQIVSWALGLVISMALWYFNFGFVAGVSWWLAAIYGVGAGLVSNGIFDTGMITKIVEALFGKNQ